jgi:hypothetical protein
MPPRRSARVADAAERVAAARSARIVAAGALAAPALAPLPHALVLHILSLLPVDCRLLCAAVCRSWRAALEEVSLWTWLDLSASALDGRPPREATGALLRAAAGRARGALRALDISNCDHIPFDALLSVVTANGGALRELCAPRVAWPPHPGEGDADVAYSLSVEALEALLHAAPGLDFLEVDVVCHDADQARRVLRREAQFGPLWLDGFTYEVVEEADEPDEAGVLALAADLTSPVPLGRLELGCALDTPAALDAVVRAALRRRVRSMRLSACDLSPAHAPALARLLRGNAHLKHLEIDGAGVALLWTARLLRFWATSCAPTPRSRRSRCAAWTCGATRRPTWRRRCCARWRGTHAWAR